MLMETPQKEATFQWACVCLTLLSMIPLHSEKTEEELVLLLILHDPRILGQKVLSQKQEEPGPLLLT